ncbi:MAG: ComF family protein [Candidatus Marinimicrobia bacterium]|nr:ComF family protein [Candidatus Neomarinimicrobiota bacterium]
MPSGGPAIRWLNPLNLIFPPVCPICGEEPDRKDVICRECLSRLSPSGLGEWSARTSAGAELDEAWSAFWFDEQLRHCIHLMKYGRNRRVAAQLGQIAYDIVASRNNFGDYQLLTPVPLHPVRKRDRGFNQALLLAKALRSRTGLPLEQRIITRRRWTRSQTGLSIEERQRNVAGSFRLIHQGQGENVLLIDDVLTTGATASACARCLKDGGYGKVAVFTVATPLKEG